MCHQLIQSFLLLQQRCLQHKVSSWASMTLLWLVAWKTCPMHPSTSPKQGLYSCPLPFSLSTELNFKFSDFVPKCRKGSRYGHDSLVDGMLKDGLWDVYNDCAMGTCAELCADKHEITREEQVFFKTQSLIP